MSEAMWRNNRGLWGRKATCGDTDSIDLQESFGGGSILNCLCWLSVWLSAQIAVWVIGGMAFVLVNWFLLCILVDLLVPWPKRAQGGPHCLEAPLELKAEVKNGDFTVNASLRARHG